MNTMTATNEQRDELGPSVLPQARPNGVEASLVNERRSTACCSLAELRAGDLMSTPRSPLPDPRSHAGQHDPGVAAGTMRAAIVAAPAANPTEQRPLWRGRDGSYDADYRRYVSPGDTLSTITQRMRRTRFADLTVLDARGEVVGVITAATVVQVLIQSESEHHRPDREDR